MDIIVGLFIAVVLVALCLGFGVAVSTVATRLLTGEEPGDKKPPDPH